MQNRQLARRSTGAANGQPIGTCYAAGYGFLKDQCLPKMALNMGHIINHHEMEREFFSSLSYLGQLYQFQPMVTTDSFPFNMYAAFKHAQTTIASHSPQTQLAIIQDEQHLACISTLKTLDTGRTLYYIPISKVCQQVQHAPEHCTTLMVLSMLSYLYKIVKVPYYTDRMTSMYNWYERIREHIEQNEEDWSDQSYRAILTEFKMLYAQGRRLRKIINQSQHLAQFAQRLQRCRKSRSVPEDLKTVATKLFHLYQQYPKRTIHDNIREAMSVSDEDHAPVFLDMYVSFYYHDTGEIAIQLRDYIDCDLQETYETLEPTSIQFFDQPHQIIQVDLDFEQQLFALITELITLLNEYA